MKRASLGISIVGDVAVPVAVLSGFAVPGRSGFCGSWGAAFRVVLGWKVGVTVGVTVGVRSPAMGWGLVGIASGGLGVLVGAWINGLVVVGPVDVV